MTVPEQAAVPEPSEKCDHICLKDAGHVERGEPHFYGYEVPSPRATPKMQINPGPLGTVATEEERWASSLAEWNRTATRADRLRVWLATGGTEEEFNEDHPVEGSE